MRAGPNPSMRTRSLTRLKRVRRVLQINDRNRDLFDAVVIGSEATGGFAAKQLTEARMRVAVLEAGKKITPADFTEHVEPHQLKYRGNSSSILRKPKSPNIMRYRPIQGRLYACVESNYPWFVNDYENPYTTAPGKPFHWIRMRVLGGRSLSWGRQSYRLSDLDFKAAGHDGFGDDWPISHDELAPYYETVEKFIGIRGQAEGLGCQNPTLTMMALTVRACEYIMEGYGKNEL